MGSAAEFAGSKSAAALTRPAPMHTLVDVITNNPPNIRMIETL